MANEITTHNWNKPPNNRRSFQYVQALFPTCRLRRGTGEPFPFAAKAQDINRISYTRLDGETGTVQRALDESDTDAFLVVKAGTIVSEQYFNAMAVDSHHLMNSMTKSFVGMLAGIAVERGQLDPAARITDYLPALNSSGWEDTTVRHLLDMTAGVNYQEDYTDPQADFWHEAAVVGWKPELVTADSPRTLFDYARSLQGKDQSDGEAFHYRTVTTNVLGFILEAVMGKPLGELLNDEIWQNLQPLCDASVVVDSVGSLYVGAGMSACARDLACFGMMMINNGEFNGRQVIPAQWLEDTIAGDETSGRNFAISAYNSLGFSHYRNQVWVKDAENGVMLALGIHGQIIYMDRKNATVIVKLSTEPECTDLDIFMEDFLAMDAIAAHLSA